MRKILLLTLVATGGLFLFWKYVKYHETKMISPDVAIVEDEKEDGIRAAQEQDFEMTKDVSLGYVPKDRLMKAAQRLMQERRLNRGAKITGLTWTERGPNSDVSGPYGNSRPGNGGATSGRIRTVWADLADPSNKTVWVAGIDGGLWKTADITASSPTWTLVNDFFANLAISSICQDPTNLSTMYFGTGEKTYNLDAVRGGGIWKSTDHGATWTLLPSTTNFWNVSKVICDASGNVYEAGIGDYTAFPNGPGLNRSTDGGTSWTNITPSGLSTNVTDIIFSSSGRLHVVCGYSVFSGTPDPAPGYRFTDNPTAATPSWTVATTAFASPQYNTQLAVSGTTLFALVSNSAFQTTPIYKSTDDGANWAATGTSPSVSGNNALSSGQGWYNMAIAVDPANANNVIAGGLNCFKTSDGGTTWNQISEWANVSGSVTQYVHADQHIIIWNGSQVLVGCDGGIFYSPDAGTTFYSRNNGLRLKQFYSCAIHPSSTNYFLAGAQDNGVHQFTNAGLSSSTEVTGGDGAFVHIDQDEPQYQFGSYVYNQYRVSTDGGSTWTSYNFNSNALFINPTDYDNINNKMYTEYGYGQYMRWDNPQTGSSVTAVSVAAFNGSYVTHVKKSPYTANRVLFGTYAGRIVLVDNANSNSPTSTNITGAGMPTSNVSCIAIGTNDNNLMATFSNYGPTGHPSHVWITTNGGIAWTDITGDLPDIPVRWSMFYPEDNTKAILATEMGVYETTSISGSSTHWTQDASFPIVRTDMLKYRPSDGTVAAATHGRGLWTSTIPLSTPYVRFAFGYNYQSEATAATTATCRNYKDYTINMNIDVAPTGSANVTLSTSGTALQGVDYDFTTNGSFSSPSNALTFANGSTTPQPITIRVYDDAKVQGDRSVTLNYSIGGGTNAQAAPSSTSYTFTIVDNDLAPNSGSNSVATTISSNRTEYMYDNGTYYFYISGSILNSLGSASASLGCVSTNLLEAGNIWQSFLAGNRSQKVFTITPTTNSTASYTVGLYYTAAELAGKDPATLKIAKTTAATMSGANATNTKLGTTTYAAYGGGYLFTASFTGFSNFFLADNGVILPVTLTVFNGHLKNATALLNWSTASEQNSKNFDVEKSADGMIFYKIGSIAAAGNSSTDKNYNFNDDKLGPVNYYRLRMNDRDGKSRVSNIVIIRYDQSAQAVWVVNNPFNNYLDLRFAKQAIRVKMQLINSTGALVSEKIVSNVSGQIRWDLSSTLSYGTYALRVIADEQAFSSKVVKH